VGAPEVQELTQLRGERRQLIKLIAELKAENKWLRKRFERNREV
jgi:chorismate mutase